VYADAVILDPYCKLLIFEQSSFVDDTSTDWKEEYKTACRDRYIATYQPETANYSSAQMNPRKRKAPEYEGHFETDYHLALDRAHKKRGMINEFDRYLGNDLFVGDERNALHWWRINHPNFPNLSKMFRTTHAVPATGAGVERVFSRSGRLARFDRGSLDHRTISQGMFYKDFMSRHERDLKAAPLEEEEDELDLSPEEQAIHAVLERYLSEGAEDKEDDEPVEEEDIYGAQYR
jgi:hypothetical protein